MLKKLFPRDTDFFDMFDSICDNIVTGTTLFQDLITNRKHGTALAHEIKDIEHSCDNMVHKTLSMLHKTFITPIDREHIRKLTNRLDDILDFADMAASAIVLYQPNKMPSQMKDLARTLVESAKAVREMIGLIRDFNKNSRRINELTIIIKGLENDADEIRRSIMVQLFEKEKNVKELIKWKDIINYIENATDICEDVSDIVEAVMLENL